MIYRSERCGAFLPVGTKYFSAVPHNPILFSVTAPFTLVALCLNMQVNDFTPLQSLCKASVLVTFNVSVSPNQKVLNVQNTCFHYFFL